MTRFGILGAAALVASALASPAIAQEVVYNPGYCAQFYPNANCQNKGPGNPLYPGYQSQAYQGQAYQNGWQDQGYRRDRRWHDSYNRYDGGMAAPIGAETYARRNGFVCVPGSLFRGEDGRQHICQ
jgi:hypothetical protein